MQPSIKKLKSNFKIALLFLTLSPALPAHAMQQPSSGYLQTIASGVVRYLFQYWSNQTALDYHHQDEQQSEPQDEHGQAQEIVSNLVPIIYDPQIEPKSIVEFIGTLTNDESSQEHFRQWQGMCSSLPKNRDSDVPQYNKNENFTYEQLKLAIATYLKQSNDAQFLTNKDNWINNTPLAENFLTHENNTFAPFIQKVIIREAAEVSFHGDLHGDIHSLLTYIADLQAKEILRGFHIIKKDFYIIFLGDYVDRGDYGAEVIYTLLNLKIANPENVFLIRGNHEDAIINGDYGFKDELNKKFPNYIHNPVFNFYNTLPVALYLGSGTPDALSFIQCCHGGMEIGFRPHEDLFKCKEKHFQKIDEINRATNFEELFNATDLSKRYQKPETTLKCFKSKLKDDIRISPYTLGYMWSDFILPGRTRYTNLRQASPGVLLEDNQGRGFAYSQLLTSKMLEVINQRIKPHEVKGVFRAHQHDYNMNGMMGLILDKNDPDNRGVAKLWASSANNGQNLWQDIVCTFNVSPDSVYGQDQQAGFNFESYGILKTAQEFKDWHLEMRQIELEFNN